MNSICNKEKCTGCFACYNACPKCAIIMREDQFGCIYPVIDQEKCINCGLCKKTCPQNNDSKYNVPKEVYAAFNVNDAVRNSSTSGGAATTFYEYIISHCGVAYGVGNIENKKICFLRLEKIEDIAKVKGSKYVHSYVEDAYKKVKRDLLANKKVVFIGTPCQIDGLKFYLKNDYENLYLIDIVCHGVPTQKILLDDIENNNINTDLVDKISFRDNNNLVFKIYGGNKCLYCSDMNSNDYYRRFYNSMIYRENCYSCRYARKDRVSDITIGDFWGLSSDTELFRDTSKGVSLILINTDKGMKLFDECSKNLFFEKRSIEEAQKYNNQLRHPASLHKKREKFVKCYLKHGYSYACKKTETIKEKMKKNKIIKNMYYKIKGR